VHLPLLASTSPQALGTSPLSTTTSTTCWTIPIPTNLHHITKTLPEGPSCLTLNPTNEVSQPVVDGYLSIMPLIATTLTTTSTSTHLATVPRLVLAIPIDITPQDLHLLSPSPKDTPQQQEKWPTWHDQQEL
jgi:hypothetical protein